MQSSVLAAVQRHFNKHEIEFEPGGTVLADGNAIRFRWDTARAVKVSRRKRIPLWETDSLLAVLIIDDIEQTLNMVRY